MSNTNFTEVSCNGCIGDLLTGSTQPADQCGFVYIAEHLVPYAFLNRIEIHLQAISFNHEDIFEPKEMVGQSFWDELTFQEQSILGPCLMYLIQEERIALSFKC